MRLLALLAVTATTIAGLQSPSAAALVDRDCADFASQQAAQIFFLNNNPAADPHNLDSDGDGVVCESNPGPYYYGSNPNPGGNNDPEPQPQSQPVKAPLKVVKVVEGNLLRLRQGNAKPFNVRLVGVRIPRSDSCMVRGARRFLKDTVKVGQVVTLVTDKKAPKRDKQKNLIAEVKPKKEKTRLGFGFDVVYEGWGLVEKYRFAAKRKYRNVSEQADWLRDGAFGECVENYGSPAHPYRPGTTFEFEGWTFTFGATDYDAAPEMAAEAAAAPGTRTFTPPAPGTTFRRVPVTATRNGDADPLTFRHVYGDEIAPITDRTYGSCGTAPNFVDQMNVAPGQSVTGYLCTARPTWDGIMDEMWVVGVPGFPSVRRFVASQ